jgi:DNA-binding Lrp family transcriptional regulator
MVRNTDEQIIEDEKKVIIELQKNAQERVNIIAKHCGFSRQKAWRIIKRLEAKDLIWGYTAIFNDETMGVNHFTLMVKRNSKKVEQQTVDQIVSRKLEDFAESLGVTVESSYFVHGEYDWILAFTAKDIIQAKRFSDSLLELNPGIIEKITVLQTMIFIRRQHILNPDRKKLKDFL